MRRPEFPIHTPAMRWGWTLAVAVSSALMLAGCGLGAGVPYRVQPVPESEWPDIKGVDIVSATSSPGSTCCEPQAGVLALRLDLPERQPYAALKDGLRGAGWIILKCDFRRPGNFYIARDGLNGWADTSRGNRQGADLFIQIERGGPVYDFQPTRC